VSGICNFIVKPVNGPYNEIFKDHPQELRDLVEDSTNKYKLEFKTSSDLLKNFELLEEKNLFLIQQTQEAEKAIDDKKQEFKKIKYKLDRETEKVKEGECLKKSLILFRSQRY